MAIDTTLLKGIALNIIKKPVKTEEDLIRFLSIWWSNKYNLPKNHPLLLNQTLEELMIDYYIDKLLNNPEESSQQTIEELEQEEEEMKQWMGAEYKAECDYLVPPDMDLKQEEAFEDIDEKFDTLGE